MTLRPGVRAWYRAQPPVLRKLIITLLCVALVAAAGVVYVEITDRSCGEPGVAHRDDTGECTGVTDGAYVFNPQLSAVSQRIKEENDRIEALDRPYATIALMIPMTPGKGLMGAQRQVLREVQGAYLAQYRANREYGAEPPIRLLLANPGRGEENHWREVAEDLAGRADGKENLRVVFGFNLSVKSTEKTIGYLTRVRDVAVVGGPITADDLRNSEEDPDKYPGLAHVVPSNSDQVRALDAYLDLKDPDKAFLVEDTHSTDLYSRSLRTAFEGVVEGASRAPETYDSSQVTLNDFNLIVNNLCDSEATTVYFSGRPPELRLLINALGKRGCSHKKYRVVTVSGASTLAHDTKVQWKAFDHGLSLEYATVTHGDAWTGTVPETGGSATDVTALSDLVGHGPKADDVGEIGPTGLADGRTITTHDSALTAIAGIRNRVKKKGLVPARESIKAAWKRLHGPEKVRGASGWICLDAYGNPYNKAVAIVKLVPGPDYERGRIVFQKLAWPKGDPPDESCTAAPE